MSRMKIPFSVFLIALFVTFYIPAFAEPTGHGKAVVKVYDPAEIKISRTSVVKKAPPQLVLPTTVLPPEALLKPDDLASKLASGEIKGSVGDGKARIILLFDGPIVEEWRKELEALGATIESFIPNYGLLITIPADNVSALSGLEHLLGVLPFSMAYKPPIQEKGSPSVASNGGGEGPAPSLVLVKGFGSDSFEDLKAAIESVGGRVIRKLPMNGALAYVPKENLSELMASPYVLAAEVAKPKTLMAPPSKPIPEDTVFFINKSDIKPMNFWATQVTGAYWFRRATGITGSGVVVAVGDTGLDTGDTIGVDDDGDGLIDEDPVEPGCWINNDGDYFINEDSPDDDNDGLIDEDPINGIDDDGDGWIDEDDPAGVDNDWDGLVDEDPVETGPPCVDDDGDGLVNEDPAGIDNDGDGLINEDPFDDDGDGRLNEDPMNYGDNDHDGLLDEDGMSDDVGCGLLDLDGDAFWFYDDDDNDGLYDEDGISGIDGLPGVDDDGDGLVDEDPAGCDNDGDGWINEDPAPGEDDDGDGLVDEDPIPFHDLFGAVFYGYTRPPFDGDEDGDGIDEDPINGIDDDGDGLVDEDPIDGVNNDFDRIDEDPIDGIDNDGDGLVDEDPAGIDNDGDGLVDEDTEIWPDYVGKIIGAIDATEWWEYTGDGSAEDFHFHGTHVAETVLGLGTSMWGKYGAHGVPYYWPPITGAAPGANLVVVRFFGDQLSWEVNYGYIDEWAAYARASHMGATITSNSWGYFAGGEYSLYEALWDAFCKGGFDWDLPPDFVPEPPMTCVFAAGNDGPGPLTLSGPGTAKNVITVGSTTNPPFFLPGSISDFSSRGPTADNRIKPDVMAPGEYVVGPLTGMFMYGWLLPQPVQALHVWAAGTSMATPHVAGAAALLKEYFQANYGIDPPPSGIKALLVNLADWMGMDPLADNDGNGNIDLYDMGFGQISFYPLLQNNKFRVCFECVNLVTGQQAEFPFVVLDNSRPIVATLAWDDAPQWITGPGVPTLVNDFDLILISPNGTVYRGNDFTPPYDDEIDTVNNVEKVIVHNPELGEWKAIVVASNTPVEDPPFSLVIMGSLKPYKVGGSFEVPLEAILIKFLIALAAAAAAYLVARRFS